MGFEMDPRELTDAERAKLKQVTQWWKDNRDWRHKADINRLAPADPAIIAEIQVAPQQDRFVAFIGSAETSAWSCPASVKLTGLNPDAMYDVTLVNTMKKPPHRVARMLYTGTLRLSGGFLMHMVLIFPTNFQIGCGF